VDPGGGCPRGRLAVKERVGEGNRFKWECQDSGGLVRKGENDIGIKFHDQKNSIGKNSGRK